MAFTLRNPFEPPAIGLRTPITHRATNGDSRNGKSDFFDRSFTTPKCAHFPANRPVPRFPSRPFSSEFYLGELEFLASDSKDVLTLMRFSDIFLFTDRHLLPEGELRM